MAAGAQAGDSDLAVGIKPASPLDRVQEQFAERPAYRIAHFSGQVVLELIQEDLDALGGVEVARHHQLHPFRPRGNHLDREVLGAPRQRQLHDIKEGFGLEGFADVLERLLAHGGEQRLGRVIGGHNDRCGGLARGPQFCQQLQAVHLMEPDVEKDQIVVFALELFQGFLGIGSHGHAVAGLREQVI